MKKCFNLLLVAAGICVALGAGCTPNQKEEKTPAAASPTPKPSSPPTAASGPETIVLMASSGNVTFSHHKHQQAGVGCSTCHGNGVGKIANLDMKWGHATCKGCHTSKGSGPRSCDGCHKK